MDGSSKLAAYAGLTEQEEARFRSPEAQRLYAPWAAAAPIHTAFASGQFWPTREFERSELYNEILRPAKGFFAAAALRPVPSGLLNVTICRQRNDSDFETAEIETLQALLPHITTAVELHQRLHAATEGYSSLIRLIDRLDSGVILTEASGMPVHANAQALRLVAEADGLGLNGALVGATAESTRRLRAAIAQIGTDAATEPLRLALDRPSHRPPLQLTLLPIWRLGAVVPGAGNAAVAIFVTAPEAAPAINRQMIADAFLMTKRESEVAALLAEGLDLQAIARALGIEGTAVRQYLKRVFGKTGVHTQAALVALVRGFADPCR